MDPLQNNYNDNFNPMYAAQPQPAFVPWEVNYERVERGIQDAIAPTPQEEELSERGTVDDASRNGNRICKTSRWPRREGSPLESLKHKLETLDHVHEVIAGVLECGIIDFAHIMIDARNRLETAALEKMESPEPEVNRADSPVGRPLGELKEGKLNSRQSPSRRGPLTPHEPADGPSGGLQNDKENWRPGEEN